MKEGGKTEPHNLSIPYPEPYIPRQLTFEIPERVNAEGGIEQELDTDYTKKLVKELIQSGVEAIAVCFLWSVANPQHELKVEEIIRSVNADLPITLSHRLNPIVREYRRASSAAIDASLKPLMQDYLLTLQSDLAKAGYQNDVLVSTSYGGSYAPNGYR